MSYPCPECHRQFGDDERCEHCDFAPPVSSREQSRAAVEAARRLLAEQRAKKTQQNRGTMSVPGVAQTTPALADPSREGADMADDTPADDEQAS